MSTINDQIEQNIADREAAKEMIALLASEQRRPRFWECIAELATAKLPQKPSPPPTNEQLEQRRLISRIEATPLGFGKYAGVLVRDIPTGYLCWLVDSNKNEFNQQLAEYVKTQHFRDKQDKGL